MQEFFSNLRALIRKELLIILKDKRSRLILVVPVFLQTVLFGYVATYDLDQVNYAVLDEDHSKTSIELLQKFKGNRIFHLTATLRNVNDIAPTIEDKKASIVIHIGPDFERKLNLGEEAPVQILADGRNSNIAGAVTSYAESIIQSYAQELTEGISSEETFFSNTLSRSWYNPNLETRWSILSSLTFLLSMMQTLVIAAQSVAREKESGSFDQLLVTPLSPTAILLGKAIPAVIVGLVQSSIVLLLAILWFGVPFAGSIAWFYLGLIVFDTAIVGMGLWVSAFCVSMQQAMLYCFALILPMSLLSGFVTPVESMPFIFQKLVLFNPALYGIKFSRIVFLQGLSPAESFQYIWPLAVMDVVFFVLAVRFFRAKLS
ncbi:MAG: ABC transporter permease [Burkholderiales bacterium]|nr:ABC transporter permease [Burkholderiales bacterium]